MINTNFSKYWYFSYFLLLPLISQAQKEHRYFVFEEIKGKKGEKPIEAVFFDSKENFIKAVAFSEKDTFPIGKSYYCLSKDCIRELYKDEKFKEKKNTISLVELDRCNPKGTKITYFFEDEKLVKKTEKHTLFALNQTLYFYDNRQRIALIVESLGYNMVISTTQFDYQTGFLENTIIEKISSFNNGGISEKKLIYIEQKK